MPDTPDVDAKDWAIINGACADADLLRIQERGLNPRSNGAHRYRNAAHRQQAALIAANARADEAEAERDLWRKLAVHLALGAAEASLPTHFTTVSGIEDAATRFLASAMFCHDDGTRYKHPGDALDAAGKAMQSAAAREAVRHELTLPTTR